MSEQKIKGAWKGKESKVAKTFSPMIGMVYKGKKNRNKKQGMEVIGVLIEVFPDQGDAILRDKENFPYCVAYDSLELILQS